MCPFLIVEYWNTKRLNEKKSDQACERIRSGGITKKTVSDVDGF